MFTAANTGTKGSETISAIKDMGMGKTSNVVRKNKDPPAFKGEWESVVSYREGLGSFWEERAFNMFLEGWTGFPELEKWEESRLRCLHNS